MCVYASVFLKNPPTTAVHHLDYTCMDSLDTYASRFTATHLTITSVAFPGTESLYAIASLFTVTHLTITSSAVPLAEHIVYA